MNAPRRPAPPPVSARPGSVSFRSGPQLLWTSGFFLAACFLVVARPARAQSLGLGFSAVSASPVSGWSIWTDVSVGFRSRPSYRWGANRGCPGFRFGGGYRCRGWGWWGPAHWGPLAVSPYMGPRAYRCLPPQQYGFGWSRPAFAWALYPIPLPYGGHPHFGYGAWSSPWSFDVHISFRGSPGYRWYGGYGYAGRSYGHRWYGAYGYAGRDFGNRWYGARQYAGGYGHYADYRYGYWPSRAEVRRPPRARRAAAPGRVGSAGWVSRDPATELTPPPRGQLRTARARTTSSATTRPAQPAGRRALSRTGPVATSPAASPDIRARSPGQSTATERPTAGTANRQRLARAQSSAPPGPLPEGSTAATERRAPGPTPQTRMASPRRATTPAPPLATTAPAPTPGTTTSPLHSARTRPPRPASSPEPSRPATTARPKPPSPGTQSAAPRRATTRAPRPSASAPQTPPRTTAVPPRTSRAQLSRSASPLRTSRPTPPARAAPPARAPTQRSRPAAAPRPSARPAPTSPPARGVLGRSGPQRNSTPVSGRAPNAGGRRATR